AKKLYISQSAVSIQIKKLETKLDIQLIERNSKNFKLTFAGKELYRMSKDVFDKILRMKFTDEIIAPKRLNIYEILKGVIAIKHI
uniref:LysR family transcriptional regulator n=1 Tax=uncultured Campylobacter sp. TaxID=218934 RepID=UPI0026279695